MLIVSKFHDYYDTAATYGIDKTVVYMRAEKAVEITPDRWPHAEDLVDKNGVKYWTSKKIVGFCGELYPLVALFNEQTKEPMHFFYDKAELVKWLADNGVAHQNGRGYWSVRDFSVKSKEGLTAFFDPITWNDLKQYFVKYNTPSFVYGNKPDKAEKGERLKLTITVNHPLKPIQFYKVKDAHTAFQDSYMYISGVLGQPEKPAKPVSDKIKAQIHGHDSPYSFKKPPGGKRWR